MNLQIVWTWKENVRSNVILVHCAVASLCYSILVHCAVASLCYSINVMVPSSVRVSILVHMSSESGYARLTYLFLLQY